jgi:Flp pilus assembly protein TadD
MTVVAFGDAEAAFDLGWSLEKDGELAEAETYYCQAVIAGHARAPSYLSVLLWKRGESAEAVSLLRRFTSDGDVLAAFSLGVLLED